MFYTLVSTLSSMQSLADQSSACGCRVQHPQHTRWKIRTTFRGQTRGKEGRDWAVTMGRCQRLKSTKKLRYLGGFVSKYMVSSKWAAGPRPPRSLATKGIPFRYSKVLKVYQLGWIVRRNVFCRGLVSGTCSTKLNYTNIYLLVKNSVNSVRFLLEHQILASDSSFFFSRLSMIRT